MSSKKEDKSEEIKFIEKPSIEEIQQKYMKWFEDNITAITLFQDSFYDVMEKVYRYHIPMNVVHFHLKTLVLGLEKEMYEAMPDELKAEFLKRKNDVDTIAGQLVDTGTDPRQLADQVRAKMDKDKKKQATDWVAGYG